MKVEQTTLPGVCLVRPKVYTDERGLFFEAWNEARWKQEGLPGGFVQDSVSGSGERVLRGLHLQHPGGQAKLVQVLQGEVYDVSVDVRRGSPTFGRSFGVTLSATNHQQVFVPVGFAHGFCVTRGPAVVAYKVTDFYNPETELTVLWNDPELAISWPVSEPILSAKDAVGLALAAVPPERLPRWKDCT
jgi:dTDP-4-dehydrorhamnose 3,5-epimerase